MNSIICAQAASNRHRPARIGSNDRCRHFRAINTQRVHGWCGGVVVGMRGRVRSTYSATFAHRRTVSTM
ncbi:unnamed protein product [Sphagnum balticum]